MKNVNGFKEAEALLKRLPQRVEDRVLQSATMAGARVMAKNVKQSAPRGDKAQQSPASKRYRRLFQNINVKPLRKLRRGKGKRGARVSTGKAFWGLFLEFGTRFIPANPWFRPAIERSTDEAVNKLREGIARGIEREAKKLVK